MRYLVCALMLFASSKLLAQQVPPTIYPQVLPNQSFTVPLSQPIWNPFGPLPASSQFIDLLGTEHYRKQIDFSKEQVEEYNQLQKEYSEATEEVFAKFPELKRKDLPWKERKVLNDKAMIEHDRLKTEFSERAKETLVPRQLSIIQSMKFRQVKRNFGLAHALSNAPFDEALETTNDQKKKFAKINAESQAEIQKVIMEMQRKVNELKADAESKLKKALTAKQRKRLKEIEGDGSEKVYDAVPVPFR